MFTPEQLEQLKGQDGKDGTNGTDGKDGVDGKTPHIGENGNWWIGDEDTGVKAEGVDGENGKDGINGTDGKDGQDGKDGLTTSIKIGDNTYTHVDGVIELPNNIIYDDTEIKEKLNAIDQLLASDNLDLDTLQEIVDVLEQDNADIAELERRLDEMPQVELPTEWDADKVGFDQDLIFTKTFGKYVL